MISLCVKNSVAFKQKPNHKMKDLSEFSADKAVIVHMTDYLPVNGEILSTKNAYKDKNGTANWNVVAADTSAVADVDTMRQDTVPVISEININRVRLKRTNVTFDDRETRVYASLKNANLNLRASLKKGHSRMKLQFDNENLLFWQNDQLLANRISTKLETGLDLNRSTRTLTLDDTRLTVNGIEFDVKVYHDIYK